MSAPTCCCIYSQSVDPSTLGLLDADYEELVSERSLHYRFILWKLGHPHHTSLILCTYSLSAPVCRPPDPTSVNPIRRLLANPIKQFLDFNVLHHWRRKPLSTPRHCLLKFKKHLGLHSSLTVSLKYLLSTVYKQSASSNVAYPPTVDRFLLQRTFPGRG